MKKIFYILTLVTLISTASIAQVAIGTDTPATGTMLTIADPTGTSGVLFPKVSIPDLGNVAPLPLGTQNGTIVYNTNVATGAGYYFFKDSRWEPIFGTVGGMAKFTNDVAGSSSFNLNSTGGAAIQLFGTTYFNDDATNYQPTNTPGAQNALRITEPGRYKIIVNMSLVGFSNAAVQRLLAVEARLRINGNGIGGVYRSSEMISPNSSTPDYGSISFTEILNITANDVITILVSGTQDPGDVYLRSLNSSSIFFERLD